MKTFALRAAIALACTLSFAAVAQTWPAKPITLVVGSAAGGSNDTFARAIGKRMSEVLGQPVALRRRQLQPPSRRPP